MRLFLAAFLISVVQPAFAQAPKLRVPDRKPAEQGGAEVAAEISQLPQKEREERIWKEVVSGNVPNFLRHLVPVPVSLTVDGRVVSGHFFALPDYLAVGSDEDYFLVPMTPFTAQRIADKVGCLLPTPRMSDLIYQAATVKLAPSPIPPTPQMTSVPVFVRHNETVHVQRSEAQTPLGALVAGDKKDIVICKALATTPGHVAIYGWHNPDGKPIQPLYLGHIALWADYSHGVRLIDRTMEVEGKKIAVSCVLADPKRSALLSSEGPLTVCRYRLKAFPHPDDPTIRVPAGERLQTFSPMPGVRVVTDEPSELKPRVRLVLFALPNGNTIEQTFGRKLRPDDDWHYDIQHIGAQTRFVRAIDCDESLVVAYIEASNHAWPTWLRTDRAAAPVAIVDAIVKRYSGRDLKIVLDSHSGGGAFEFAYIRSVDKIPDQIDRIAFLDPEYNYDKDVHLAKIAEWLRHYNHFLCAIAYDDFAARYEGKPFVSAEGGTWGRSHAMLTDLHELFSIPRSNNDDPERFEGLEGRIVFLLKENPKAQILHTVQIERNGFIESLLSGTMLEGQGYVYFGPRAYSKFIRE